MCFLRERPVSHVGETAWLCGLGTMPPMLSGAIDAVDRSTLTASW